MSNLGGGHRYSPVSVCAIPIDFSYFLERQRTAGNIWARSRSSCGSNYSVLLNNAAGPDINLPGRILAELLSGKHRNRFPRQPTIGRQSRCWCFPVYIKFLFFCIWATAIISLFSSLFSLLLFLLSFFVIFSLLFSSAHHLAQTL